MFFVVTTGRSGSQTIAHVLSQSPDCVCLHEPAPTLVKEATLYQYGLLSDEWLKAILLSTRGPTLGGKVYGESNQKLANLIPVLAQAFPDSRFIWLVRDGRDVVASTHFARQWYKPIGELGHRKHLAHSLKLKEWIWYRLRGDLTGDMATREWELLSRFEKNCWYWARTNEIIQGHLARLPQERWMPLKLVELFDRLPQVCHFVGIQVPVDIEQVRYNASVGKRALAVESNRWPNWSAEQRAAFERQCQGMMDQLYPDWRDERGHWRETSPASADLPAKGPSQRQCIRLKLASLFGRGE